MTTNLDAFNMLKGFIGFTDKDAENLKALAPLFEAHGATITDAFYDKLLAEEDAAALIEGRVEQLKKTHARWMAELFAGDYGDGYFDNRWKIGLAHVRVGVRPHWVEAVMSFLRAEGLKAMAGEIADIEALTDRYASLVKVLDLDLMIINLAYGEERLERLSSFTGMSRKLLERCVTQAKK
jgi:hemoglobin-like flavoprotein